MDNKGKRFQTDLISRSEYELTWNAALETGGVLVADQVQISLDIQASKA